MEVVLLQNVGGVGRKGDVKNVKEGYFLNFLAPRKLAEKANKGALRRVADMQKKEVMDAEKLKENAQAAKEKLDGLKVEIEAKANGDKLYAAIGAEDLIKEIVELARIRLDRKSFGKNLHLKTVGEHEVPVDLAGGLQAKVKVVIKQKLI